MTKTAPKIPAHLVKVEVKGNKMLSPLQSDVNSLVVTTEEEYEAADTLLGDIKQARTAWAKEMDPILTPLKKAIDAAKEAQAGAAALNKKIDGPLTEMEASVKEKMREFKLTEARAIAQAQQEKDAEDERLRRELEQAALREQNARTKTQRDKLQTQREQLEAWAEERAKAPVQTAVKVTGSQARRLRRVRVTDLEPFLRAILDGTISFEVLSVDLELLAGEVKDWPIGKQALGIEVYEDIVIAGRSR